MRGATDRRGEVPASPQSLAWGDVGEMVRRHRLANNHDGKALSGGGGGEGEAGGARAQNTKVRAQGLVTIHYDAPLFAPAFSS